MSRTSRTLKAGKGKKKSDADVLSAQDSIKSVSVEKTTYKPAGDVVNIFTIYDHFGHLAQIKFDRNRNVPKQLLKVIGLTLHFHHHLTCIIINQGLNKPCLHELHRFLTHANNNITDLCLDDTSLGDGGYDVLLQSTSHLTNLSIARCKLDDEAVKKLALKLMHPMPASQTLLLLNLASNSMTDIGAKFLAFALRTNRRLVYLNVSDNSISDDGVGAICSSLEEFVVSHDEMVQARSKRLNYLRDKHKLAADIFQELKSTDFKLLKKKGPKPGTTNIATNCPTKKSKDDEEGNMDAHLLEMAEAMAAQKLGELNEPFITDNVYSKDDIFYCKGNNTLAYLNLNYNNITYPSLKKFVFVLTYQNGIKRLPRGLVHLSIEGNNIPAACPELNQINAILSSYLISNAKASLVSVVKKKVAI